jgi:transcriptional regulator with GAF, ATPase, and Fis domain
VAVAEEFLHVSPAEVSVILGKHLAMRNARFPDGVVAEFRVPIDEHGQLLVSHVASDQLFPAVPFLDVWAAMESGNAEQLRQWVGGKIVLLLTSPQGLASLGQTNLLNSILTQNWTVSSRPMWRIIGGVALAGFGAWLLLTLRGWKGIAAAVTLLCAYIGIVFIALATGAVLLPVFIPVTAFVLASAAAVFWLQLSAGHRVTVLEGRIQKVQQELVAVRQALTLQESSVEVLEEDLEAARQAVARSTGKEEEIASAAQALRVELAEAKTAEESSRQRLFQLESELRGLRASTTQSSGVEDTAIEGLRLECEEMGIITRDRAVLAIFRETKKISRSTIAVLISGEPGTGKELFARAVHKLSPRAHHPFVSVNMAAISPNLFESELFGHIKGSFTGAIGDRKGYFEQAHQGTIFLDEIGDLAMEHQGKLLRVLQEKTFHRVGAARATTVDVRIVAATNRDLERGVLEGWFREDLYFRLKGIVLRLPPLRERPQDVALLAERYLAIAAVQNGRVELGLSSDALRTLQAHPWKGNVRELEHCMQQAAILAEGKLIMKEDLRLAAPLRQSARNLAAPFLTADPASDEAVLTCLREEKFDMQATARALGWDRSTVTQRLKGMGFRALVESGGDRAKAAIILAGNPELARTVELKLAEYYEHLMKSIQDFRSADEAVAACKKRYKNLPDRHFRSMETLIRQFYQRRSG